MGCTGFSRTSIERVFSWFSMSFTEFLIHWIMDFSLKFDENLLGFFMDQVFMGFTGFH